MIRWLAIAVCLLPSTLAAAPIAVRSGEHTDFSRVVLTFSTSPDWTLGRTSNGYRLRIAGESRQFDLDDVFRKMTTNRIRAIRPTDGGLQFDVDCLCHIDAFEFRSGLLVIDVKDGPPVASSPFEAGFSSDEVAISERPSNNNPSITPHPPAEPISLALAPGEVKLGQQFPKKPQNKATDPPGPSSNPTSALKLDPVQQPAPELAASLRAYQMREQLLKQLGRASAQGLVAAPQAAKPVRNSENELAVSVTSKKKEVKKAAMEEHLNFRTETQIDRDAPMPEPPELTAIGVKCLPAELTDVSLWQGDSNAWENVVRARAKLSDEVDHISDSAVLNLVHAYLFAGFGAEALALLEAAAENSVDRDVLAEIARLMDGQSLEASAAINSQITCDTPGALWAALASDDWPGTDFANTSAILLSFSALPLHLRRELGPGLSQKFLAKNDEESARAVRNAIARADGEHGSKFDILEANMMARSGDLDAATGTLETVISRGDDNSPQALFDLMSLLLQNRKAPTRDMVVAAQALMFERQGSDFERQMAPILVQALSKLGEHGEAVQALLRLPTAEAELSDQVANNLVELEHDAQFLRFSFSSTFSKLDAAISPKARANFSRRLRELGFDDKATELGVGDPPMGVSKYPEQSDATSITANVLSAPSAGPAAAISPDTNESPPPQDLTALPPLAKGRALIARSKKIQELANKVLTN